MTQLTLRQTLRLATRAEHASVDRMISAFDLSSRAGYAAFLRLHAAVLLPLESLLEENGVETELPDWQSRRRSQALLSDLAQFGLSDFPRLTPSFENLPAARAGILYVTEGSRLGSSMLASRLENSGLEAPKTFLLHGQGAPLWPGFVGWLNGLTLNMDQTRAAVESARRVFSLYVKALVEGREVST